MYDRCVRETKSKGGPVTDPPVGGEQTHGDSVFGCHVVFVCVL